MPTRHLAAAALLAALAASARAADPLPPTAADLSGARAVALAGTRGLAGGNEGIFLNPASLAARRRYSIEAQYELDRAGGSNAGQWFTLSAVDSETGPLAGGFAYSRIVSGPSGGNVLHGSLAAPLSSSVFLGFTGKYLSLSGAEDVSAATMDAGAFLKLGLVSAGFTGYNLVNVHHPQQAPRAYGGGIAVGDDRRFHVTADWKRDLDRKIGADGRSVSSDSWGAGFELLVSGNVPLRAGILKDDTRDLKAWSVGAGLVSTSGAAFDVTYRQSISDPADRTFAAGLKLFILAG